MGKVLASGGRSGQISSFFQNLVKAGDIYIQLDKYAQLLTHVSSVAVLWAPIGTPMLRSLGFGPFRRSRARVWLPGVDLGRFRDF